VATPIGPIGEGNRASAAGHGWRLPFPCQGQKPCIVDVSPHEFVVVGRPTHPRVLLSTLLWDPTRKEYLCNPLGLTGRVRRQKLLSPYQRSSNRSVQPNHRSRPSRAKSRSGARGARVNLPVRFDRTSCHQHHERKVTNTCLPAPSSRLFLPKDSGSSPRMAAPLLIFSSTAHQSSPETLTPCNSGNLSPSKKRPIHAIRAG
jgi:hypothetical protein